MDFKYSVTLPGEKNILYNEKISQDAIKITAGQMVQELDLSKKIIKLPESVIKTENIENESITQEKLAKDIDFNVNDLIANGNIILGTQDKQQRLLFKGWTGDGEYHAGIENRQYKSEGELKDETELLIWQLNDSGIGSEVGPDRIRMLSNEIIFQTSETRVVNDNEQDIDYYAAEKNTIMKLSEETNIEMYKEINMNNNEIKNVKDININENLEVGGDLNIIGNLYVSGTTTQTNIQELDVEDKQIILGNVEIPSDMTAQDGGVILKGTTDKTILWNNGNWTSSENINVGENKEYKINNISVLSGTTLGANVLNSSLKTVGELTSLTVDGNTTIRGDLDMNNKDINNIKEVNGEIINGTTINGTTINGTTMNIENINSATVEAVEYKVNNKIVLTETTLGTSVVNSSLTQVGELTSLSVGGNTIIKGELDMNNQNIKNTKSVDVTEEYKINNNTILTATTLGASVVNSSITSVGTLTNLNVGGNTTIDGDLDMLTNNINNVGIINTGSVNAQTGYKINNINVLTETTLGPNIINSSLTTVGTLVNLNVGGNVEISGEMNMNNQDINNVKILNVQDIEGGNINATEYKINNASVLTNTTLGTGIVNSSLTKVGTLIELNVQGATSIGGDLDMNNNNITNVNEITTGTGNITTMNVGTINATGDVEMNGNKIRNINEITTVIGNITTLNTGAINATGNMNMNNKNIENINTIKVENIENIKRIKYLDNSINIGELAGEITQGIQAIAIGGGAGSNIQGIQAIAIGTGAGANTQGTQAIAIGSGAGQTTQGENSIAIGKLAGEIGQISNSIIINATGNVLNNTTSGLYIKPIRGETELTNKKMMYYDETTGEIIYTNYNTININDSEITGVSRINFTQDSNIKEDITFDISTSKEIKITSSKTNFLSEIDMNNNNIKNVNEITTGTINTGATNITGELNMNNNNIINVNEITSEIVNTGGANITGDIDMNENNIINVNNIRFKTSEGIKIGEEAGLNTQEIYSIAVGYRAGKDNQGTNGIAIGTIAGRESQGEYSVAIGYQAGKVLQGDNSIAIGNRAGETNQHNSTIILNGTSIPLDSTQTGSLYVKPIRGETDLISKKIMYYDEVSGEITYTNDSSINLNTSTIENVSAINYVQGASIIEGTTFDISTDKILKIKNKGLVISTEGNIGINKENPTERVDILDGNVNITNGGLKINNTTKNMSYIKTETGTINIGSTENTNFGETNYNLIYSSDTINNNGLAIGTINANEDLILGVNNREVIRLEETNQKIKISEKIDMNNNDIININKLGIGTSTPKTKLQIGASIILDDNYIYDNNSVSIIHQTPTSNTVLNDPKEVLLLGRQGTDTESNGAAASLRISRYEDDGINSRTRLDVLMAHENFMTNAPTIMTALSNGNVTFNTNEFTLNAGTNGDSVLKMISNTDNNNDGDNTRIEMYQKGGKVGEIGMNNNTLEIKNRNSVDNEIKFYLNEGVDEKNPLTIQESGINLNNRNILNVNTIFGDSPIALSLNASGSHQIIIRENSLERTSFYQFGGIYENEAGYIFYTGGLKSEQTKKVQISNDKTGIYNELTMNSNPISEISEINFVNGTSIIEGVTLDIILNQEANINGTKMNIDGTELKVDTEKIITGEKLNNISINIKDNTGNTNNYLISLDENGIGKFYNSTFEIGDKNNTNNGALIIGTNTNVSINKNIDMLSNEINNISGINYVNGSSIIEGEALEIESNNKEIKINSDKIVIDTIGNIGIGTTSPEEKIDILGNIQLTDIIGEQTMEIKTKYVGEGAPAGTNLEIKAGDSTRSDASGGVLRLKSGDSGINGGNGGDLILSSGSGVNQNGVIVFQEAGNGGASAYVDGTISTFGYKPGAGNQPIQIKAGASTDGIGGDVYITAGQGGIDKKGGNVYIRPGEGQGIEINNYSNTIINENGGRVGIGTNNPLRKLHIENGSAIIENTSVADENILTLRGRANGGDYPSILKIDQGNGASVPNQGIQIEYVGRDKEGGIYEGAAIRAAHTDTETTTAATELVFMTSNNKTMTEKVRINKLGNVGIGTTNPQEKLDVNGNIRIQKESSGNSKGSHDILLYGTTSTGIDTPQAKINSTVYPANTNAGNLNFYTENTVNNLIKRMDIDGAGNIGFYEETGTTKRFIWDATNEVVGINGTSPNTKLNINGSATNNNKLISINSVGVGTGIAEPIYGLYSNIGASNSSTELYGIYSNLNYIGGADKSYSGYFKNIGNPSKPSWGIYAETNQTDTNGPATAKAGEFIVKADLKPNTTLGKTIGINVENEALNGTNAIGINIKTKSYGTIVEDNVIPLKIENEGEEGIIEEIFRINALGNVGIGTATPVSKLNVYSKTGLPLKVEAEAGGGADLISIFKGHNAGFIDITRNNDTSKIRIGVSSSNKGLIQSTVNNLSIQNNNAEEILSIDGVNNRVGINTEPARALDVNSGGDGYVMRLQRTSALQYEIGIDNLVTGDAIDYIIQPLQARSGYLFRTRDNNNNNVSALSINKDGGIGIGTLEPTRKLEVYESNIGIAVVGKMKSNAITNLSVLEYENNGVTSAVGPLIGSRNNDIVLLTGQTGELPTIKMIVDETGKVGIGTENPTEKIDVIGNINVNDNKIKNVNEIDVDNITSSNGEIKINKPININNSTYTANTVVNRIKGRIGIENYDETDQLALISLKSISGFQSLIYHNTNDDLILRGYNTTKIQSNNTILNIDDNIIEIVNGELKIENVNGEGVIRTTNDYEIRIKEGGLNKTSFYQIGGTYVNDEGYIFYTGGTKINQTMKMKISDDKTGIFNELEMNNNNINNVNTINAANLNITNIDATTINTTTVDATEYKINNISVLTSDTLGAGIENSSLTTVGTLLGLNVNGKTTTTELDVNGNVLITGTLDMNIQDINNVKTLNVGTINSTSITTSTVNTTLDYKINNASVLTTDTIGPGIINSSLTSVGTLTGLTVSGATSLLSKLQIGASIIDDNNYIYDNNSVSIIHQTPTSNTVLNDPKEVLLLGRQGTGLEAYGAAASFRISRYEDDGTNSRTRLDMVMAHDEFMTNAPTIMTALSNGNIGIGTETPTEKLEVNGNIKATSINVENITVTNTLTLPSNVISTINIADNSITTEKIVDESITVEKLSNVLDLSLKTMTLPTDVISTTNIVNESVTVGKLSNALDLSLKTITLPTNVVSTSNIANDSITTEKILDENVTVNKLSNVLDLSLKTVTLPTDVVSTSNIANDSITTEKIINESVTVNKLSNALDLSLKTVTLPINVISTNNIVDESITVNKLSNVLDLSLKTVTLPTDVISTTNIVDESITVNKLSNVLDLSLKTVTLPSNVVSTSNIANDSITTEKIVDGNVTVEKLSNALDLSLKTVTLPTDVISTSNILNESVTVEKLSNVLDLSLKTVTLPTDVISTINIANNSITTEKIVDEAVTVEKLSNVLDLSLKTVTLPSNMISTSNIVNNSITTEKIVDENVTVEKLSNILDLSLKTVTLPTDVVSTTNILNESVTVNKLSNVLDLSLKTVTLPTDVVTTSNIANNSITTEKIVDENVTVEKLSNVLDLSLKTVTLPTDVVSTINIVNENVTVEKLSNILDLSLKTITLPINVVSTSNILDESVTIDKLSNVLDLSLKTITLPSNVISTSNIANDSITTEKIVDESITVNKLSNVLDLSLKTITLPIDVISTTNILNESVTVEKLSNILDLSLKTVTLPTDVVLTTNIANNSITTEKIVDESITVNKLSNILDLSLKTITLPIDVISTTNILNESVTVNKLSNSLDLTLKTVTLPTDVVSTSNIVDENVTVNKLSNILDLSLKTVTLPANVVSTSNIINGSVTTEKIVDEAVTVNKLSNALDLSLKTVTLPANVVSTSNIVNENVTVNKLSNILDLSLKTVTLPINVVSTSNILDESITVEKLSNVLDLSLKTLTLPIDVISTNNIANDSITTEKIVDGNVTVEKLSNILDLSLKTITLPSNVVSTSNIANNSITTEKINIDSDLDMNNNKIINVNGIGIGITNPTTKLEVYESNVGTAIVGKIKSNAVTNLCVLEYENNGVTSTIGPTIGSKNNNIVMYTGQAGEIPSNRLTIDEIGNVGIGTETPTEKLDINGNVNITGDLYISGTTTNINTQDLYVKDHQIVIGNVTTPTDVTAFNGGIVLKGTTDKSIIWSEGKWNVSENMNLGVGKEYKINNETVLTETSLGNNIINSSLTTVGTLTGLIVSGTTSLLSNVDINNNDIINVNNIRFANNEVVSIGMNNNTLEIKNKNANEKIEFYLNEGVNEKNILTIQESGINMNNNEINGVSYLGMTGILQMNNNEINGASYLGMAGNLEMNNNEINNVSYLDMEGNLEMNNHVINNVLYLGMTGSIEMNNNSIMNVNTGTFKNITLNGTTHPGITFTDTDGNGIIRYSSTFNQFEILNNQDGENLKPGKLVLREDDNNINIRGYGYYMESDIQNNNRARIGVVNAGEPVISYEIRNTGDIVYNDKNISNVNEINVNNKIVIDNGISNSIAKIELINDNDKQFHMGIGGTTTTAGEEYQDNPYLYSSDTSKKIYTNVGMKIDGELDMNNNNISGINVLTINGGGESIVIQDRNEAGSNHGYMSFYNKESQRKGYIGYGADDTDILSIVNEITTGKIQIVAAGSEIMRISDGGNVGIGTSNPTAKLEVNGEAKINGELDMTNNNISNVNNITVSGTTNVNNININGTTKIASLINMGDDVTYGRDFYIYNDNSYVEINRQTEHPIHVATNNIRRVTIASDGNVGIGTTIPSEKLEVNGNAKITGNLLMGTNANNYQNIRLGGGNSFGYIGGNFGAYTDGINYTYNHDPVNDSVTIAGGATARYQIGYGEHKFYTGTTGQKPNTAKMIMNNTNITMYDELDMNNNNISNINNVEINGRIRLNGNTGTTGQVLTSQGSGDPIWTTPTTGPTVLYYKGTAPNSFTAVNIYAGTYISIRYNNGLEIKYNTGTTYRARGHQIFDTNNSDNIQVNIGTTYTDVLGSQYTGWVQVYPLNNISRPFYKIDFTSFINSGTHYWFVTINEHN